MNGLPPLGKALRKIRIEHTLTQGKVADFLGISVAFYSAIETGSKPLSQTHLDMLLSTIPLTQVQTAELKSLAIQSWKEVRIRTQNLQPEKVELVAEFARSFDKINSEEQAIILNLLKQGAQK